MTDFSTELRLLAEVIAVAGVETRAALARQDTVGWAKWDSLSHGCAVALANASDGMSDEEVDQILADGHRSALDRVYGGGAAAGAA